jgi:hypothetical protein
MLKDAGGPQRGDVSADAGKEKPWHTDGVLVSWYHTNPLTTGRKLDLTNIKAFFHLAK